MKSNAEWPCVTALSVAGALDSLYLLLFQTKKVKRLVCPVFGGGCEKVAGSNVAFPGGIPDAIFGVAGYAAAAATSAAIPRTNGRTRRLLAKAAIGGSVVAAGLSVYLTYAQPAKTGAWCFWCLTSAAISAAMAPVAIAGGLKVLREDSSAK